ncbi:hypothetical protein C8R45DRAFT_51475 [Mycena sanguinolenta]|nr:hypothetical protein C8R45DRAFT_51475 [Mycena sanguinolenta]
MDSDCVSVQSSVLSADIHASSLLATPELTPPSSCGSCYLSDTSDFLHPHASITGPHGSVLVSETGHIPVDSVSKIPTKLPSSPPPRRPRKLRKSRPDVPELKSWRYVPEPIPDLSIPGSSEEPPPPTPQSPHRRLFRAWLFISRPSTPEPRSRRSSLLVIPTAAAVVYPPIRYQLDDESSENLQVPAVTAKGSISRPRAPDPSISIQNANTRALTSLAWTGQLPSVLLTPLSEFSEDGSACGEGDKHLYERTSVPLRQAVSYQHSSSLGRKGRGTLAAAIISGELTDEMFVNEVEWMRVKGNLLGIRESIADVYPSSSEFIPASAVLIDPSSLSATWQRARRALLTCRELIRTERNYLASLVILMSDGTAAPAPPLILTYTPALIQASEDLLFRMEANPSAQGVAEAFIQAEPTLETAFVAWCGVSRDFFFSPPRPTIRSRAASSIIRRELDSSIAMPLKRRVTTWTQTKRTPSLGSHEGTTALPSGNPSKRRSLPTVRDLAILPIQRVMRYALLFRDLSATVPSNTPSHTFVERALQVAMNIAQKSDRAQGNAASLRKSI